tara:strand:+ start:5561 stop:6199 length:639 start_codon:yes stop_codon:yes gene_type:complete
MNSNINVKTYGITDPRFGTAVNRIFLVVEELDSKDKLYENYNFDGLKIHEWIALSLYEDQNSNCIGFSSVIRREDVWGNGARILNRFLKSPNYRFENDKRLLSTATKKMIRQQLEIVEELGYDFAFISRESNGKRNVLQHYLKYYNEVEWNYPLNRYQMFHVDHDVMIENPILSCWQHIAWTSFRPHVKDINIDNITEDEFIELKKIRDSKD